MTQKNLKLNMQEIPTSKFLRSPNGRLMVMEMAKTTTTTTAGVNDACRDSRKMSGPKQEQIYNSRDFIATISCIRNHSVKNGAILIYGRGNLWIYELRRM